MSKTLLNITEDMQALDDLLAELGGDVTDEQVAAYVDQLFKELDGDFNAKVDGYVALIRQNEARAEAQAKEADHLAGMAKRSQANADWLKARLHAVMQIRGMTKAGSTRQATVCKAGGAQPVVLAVDACNLPPHLQRVVLPTVDGETYQAIAGVVAARSVEADKAAIRAALEAGDDLGGVASFGERGTYLRVK